MAAIPFPAIDTLLSLPFLSFIVLPSAISNFPWTSSFNLLFFWLTWATVVWSHSPLNIEFYGTLAIRTLFYVLPCSLFLLLDTALPSFSAGIKRHGDRGLPTRALPRRSIFSYAGIVLINIFGALLVQVGVDFIFTKFLGVRSTVRITVALPMPLGLAKDLTRAYLVRGPLAYYIHSRFLHAPRRANPVRRQLTRWHHSWHHSLKTTMPFAAVYDHPAVYLLHGFLPVYLPALLFRFHILTYFLFLALTGLEEAFAWSGYVVLPSTILLAGMARRKEAHLMIGGGNYGPWGVMDWLHGTTIGERDVMDDVGDEAEKRDVKGKARRAVDDAGDAVRDKVRARQKEAVSILESESDETRPRRAVRRRQQS